MQRALRRAAAEEAERESKTVPPAKRRRQEAEAEEDEDEGEESEEGSDAETSEEELELNVDEDGRVAIFGGEALDYCFRSYPELLAPGAAGLDFVTLRKDCETAFTSRAAKKGEQYSSGETFWVPAGGSEPPATLLEELALAIFQLHAGKSEFDPEKSGAEWWTLVVDEGDDVGWHWDRDYGLEADTDFKLHPHMSTVTYLSRAGAPTVMLDICEAARDEELVEASHAIVSLPRIGKHVVFDGRWLHGAPSELSDLSSLQKLPEAEMFASCAGKRCTFLVNIWVNHHPVGSAPYPNEAGKLSPSSRGALSKLVAAGSPSLPADLKSGGGEESFTWPLKDGDEEGYGEDSSDAGEEPYDNPSVAEANARDAEGKRQFCLSLPMKELREMAGAGKADAFDVKLVSGSSKVRIL